MNFRKNINILSDITTGGLISAFGTIIYLTKEKYFPKDKKQRKKLKKHITKHGLEVEFSPIATALTISTALTIIDDLKKGDKYTIFSSAIFTTILFNLLVFRKK